LTPTWTGGTWDSSTHVRVAALYDIHANLPALEAVLREVEVAEPDRIVIGGDATTPIARPQRCRNLAHVERRPSRSRRVSPVTLVEPRVPTTLARTMRGETPRSVVLTALRRPL
jgi:Icc-related predicted phosphoesterase